MGPMDKKDIRNRLKECFRRCASGRKQLRNCVIDIMDAGLTKQDVLDVTDEMATGKWKDEAYLCAVTAIGQALRYEEKHKKTRPVSIEGEVKELMKNKLKQCFKKCGYARRQLRKRVINALNVGLTREEILAITDDIVGGFGKDKVSVCAIIAVEQVLKESEIEKGFERCFQNCVRARERLRRCVVNALDARMTIKLRWSSHYNIWFILTS